MTGPVDSGSIFSPSFFVGQWIWQKAKYRMWICNAFFIFFFLPWSAKFVAWSTGIVTGGHPPLELPPTM
jgi:hypothetical protein